MLSEIAKRWLVHARSVFSCDEHKRACDAPAVSGIDATIRWPGFVGPQYEDAKKKLLFLGRIHNPSGWLSHPGLGDLQPIIREWLDGKLADDIFYRDYNRVYARLLPTWGPWYKVYAALAAAGGVDENSVAYANVAKCWQYPGRESKLQRACSGAFPLEGLIDVVKPDGVFLLAPESWVSRVPGARVRSVPFMCDSAPHFQLPYERMKAAIQWVESL